MRDLPGLVSLEWSFNFDHTETYKSFFFSILLFYLLPGMCKYFGAGVLMRLGLRAFEATAFHNTIS